jgi:branched-chain amino acid transport system ATP-binding protein
VSLLKTEDLSIHFGAVKAVDMVSFEVNNDERIAIIGPNGAGKTTLFNLINGQLVPTSGKIHFLDQNITRMPVHKRAQLGMMRSFQLVSLFLELSVMENAMLSLYGNTNYKKKLFRSLYSCSEIVGKAEQALKTVNLWEKKDVLVKNISYGEQRKLEIGLSIAYQPKLLMLDEPSNGLTKQESNEVADMINALDKNMGVLMVAHDMDFVFKVAKRIMVLYFGTLIADGTPEEIRNDPKVRECYMGLKEEETYDAQN